MKKIINYLVVFLSATVILASCDYNSQFDGLDDMTKPTSIETLTDSLIPADYAKLSTEALGMQTNASDSVAAAAIKTENALNATFGPELMIPLYLKENYISADNGAKAIITYNYNNGTSIDSGLVAVFSCKGTGIWQLSAPYLDEDFSSQAGDKSPIVLDEWINVDLSGTKSWYSSTYGGITFAQFSSRNFGELNDIWLITKSMDLSAAKTPEFSFDIINGYYTNECLKVLVSTDFDGTEANIKAATWTDITTSFTLPNKPSGFTTWASAGIADLTPYIAPSVYIAFEYVGDDIANDHTTTYRLKNILVKESE